MRATGFQFTVSDSGFCVLAIIAFMLIAGCTQPAPEPEEDKTGITEPAQPPGQPPAQPPPAMANETKNLSADGDLFSDDLDEAISDLEAVE
jgi:hypothetical protein